MVSGTTSGLVGTKYYMSLQYRNKSKFQLTSPTPTQLPAVALSAGHIVYLKLKLETLQFMPGIKNLNLIFFVFFLNFKQKWPKKKFKIQNSKKI
jgi:hypothetical protein